MIDHLQLLDELEQQTAALEAAVSHQHWEESQRLMTSRLAILQQLSAEPASDPQVRQRIVAVATKLAEQEQLLVQVLHQQQQAIEHSLLNLRTAQRARQLYQQHR